MAMGYPLRMVSQQIQLQVVLELEEKHMYHSLQIRCRQKGKVK